MRYKVLWEMDQHYRVVSASQYEAIGHEADTLFSGGIAECEAWIRLNEGGYL